MMDRTHPLPLTQQARLLTLSRSSLYYTPRPVSECDLRLMKKIDILHTAHPFAGARLLRDLLRLDQDVVGHRHVATLMTTKVQRPREWGVRRSIGNPRPANPIPTTRSTPTS